MKRKRVEKRTEVVVAWLNRAEWEQVVEQLYSTDHQLQSHSLHRLSAWRSRFGPSTPVAVESTANLVRCQILDHSGRLEGDDLVLLYGMALTRFVNLILERKQGKVAKPLRRLASNLNIPEWIVNLRHDMTHRRLPTLKWCRKGCEYVLNWLRQEFWSRQLSSISDWNSSSEEEEDDEDAEERTKKREEEVVIRQKEIERHKRARELLISYEREQFQVYEEMLKRGSAHGSWPEASADLSWILAQIQQFNSESREILIDVLVQDGFLIPTAEQLESLDIDPSEDLLDPATPCVPRAFLRFWLPLLKLLNSSPFIGQLLTRLFAELGREPTNHRAYYSSAWIGEILSGSGKASGESKAGRKMRAARETIFANRTPFRWHELLSACVSAPCAATAFLLRQILMSMDKPLPPSTQRSLLRLCAIYTQGRLGDGSPGDADHAQPVYTVESLQERVGVAAPNRHALCADRAAGSPQATPVREVREQPSAESVQERNAALRGSPWSVCTDKVQWGRYPLGKVPGQTDDPACLMVEMYSTLNVFDQQVKGHTHHATDGAPLQNRPGSEGLVWTQNDLNKIKAGLKLF
ncbi:ribosomal biogenesis protein LAS1L isoform X2 [Trichomycterus rosablanca]